MIGDWVYNFINNIFSHVYRLNRLQDRLEFIIGYFLDPAPRETATEGLPAYCQRITPKQALRYTKYYYLVWRDDYLMIKNMDISIFSKKELKFFEKRKNEVDTTYFVYQKYYLESLERVKEEKELKQKV